MSPANTQPTAAQIALWRSLTRQGGPDNEWAATKLREHEAVESAATGEGLGPTSEAQSDLLVPDYRQTEAYLGTDFQLIPLHRPRERARDGRDRSKSPRDSAWQGRHYDPAEVLETCRAEQRNVGVRVKQSQLILDEDPRNGGAESFRRLCADSGLDPTTCPRVITGSGGAHYYLKRDPALDIPKGNDKYPGIDFLSHEGHQAVAAGSVHPNGNHYRLDFNHPPLAAAPMMPAGLVAALVRKPKAEKPKDTATPLITPEQLAAMLEVIPVKEHDTGEKWREVIHAAKVAVGGNPAGRKLVQDWSARDAERWPNGRADAGDVWDRSDVERPHGITAATLFKKVVDAGHADLIPPSAAIGPVVSVDDHLARARAFAAAKRPHVHHYRDDFVDHEAGRYAIVADDTMRANAYGFLDVCSKVVTSGRGKDAKPIRVPFKPWPDIVSATLDALKAVCHVLPSLDQPCWLDGRAGPDPAHLISFPNGILNLETGELLPPDPMLFTPHSCAFDYNPNAKPPRQWLRFLLQVFEGEKDQIRSWQEWNGYCLTGDVSQEKAALLIGPKRSGKDTMRRALQSLLPAGAICGPTLDSMGTNFGMSAFIGKSLAIVGDMRIGGKCDQDLLAENVLKLTGRGLFTIDRKHKDHWHGSLPCKLTLVSNERPRIKDASGALASRFLVYRTRATFYGRENPNLFRDKLAPELPGIMLWALAGLRRMRKRGRITEPECSIKEREQLAREGSPVLAYLDERLILDASAEVEKDKLYSDYKAWSEGHGLFAKDKTWFTRDLEAASGGKVRAAKMGPRDKRVPSLKGIRLASPKDREGENALPF